MDNYIKIEIQTSSSEQLEILVAELLEIKFNGFQEDESLLSAFIEEEDFNEPLLISILSVGNILFTKSTISKTNWNQKWESEFLPVVINDFVAVRAAFHFPIQSVAHDIIITPKMSFGTGHNPTTYLMLKEMEKINFRNKSVLDFGTGTGILSILANKLGADRITAIDTDDWSIENAKENFKVNHCFNIEVIQSNTTNQLKKFDVILSNINLNVIISELNNFRNISNISTVLLLSGFLKSDEKALLEKVDNAGFTCKRIQQKEEWISIVLSL